MEFSALVAAFQPLIPITVFVAVGLFLIKEGLEWVKRRRADVRKLGAIKRIVARDLEMNGWVIHCYQNALGAMEMLDLDPDQRMRIYSPAGGRPHYEHWEESEGDDAVRSGGLYPAPISANVEKYLLDAATLDRRLLEHMEAASTALAELEHIRLSTMEQIEEPLHREGFVEYARRELSDVEAELTKLYRYCTGKDKITARIR